MRRREFITLLGGAAVAWPLIPRVEAQSAAKVYRVGFLLGATGESVASLFHALEEGLRELGYVEGRNIVFVQRYGDGRMERLPDLAAELVRLKVDVIVTGTNLHVAAVRRATTTIPIVMIFTADPVGAGFVASLARPGGNVTGLTADASPDLWAKYLSLLKEVVPGLSRVGVLGQVASQVGFAELEAASQNLGVALEVADLQRPEDIDRAFATMISQRVEALVVVVGPLTYLLRQEIADAALKHQLPAMTNASQFAQAGLLMSYGPNVEDLYRQAATYVDKILRGASPADLPVGQPTKFEFVINMKTAKALGLEVPPSLLATADEVIE
ncbi:MAG: ABC transporter substrate-binding protein [Bradyrhizobium sp.]|nr:ABC transporter substrate-binding protein [Bradyrhizobium sp.]